MSWIGCVTAFIRKYWPEGVTAVTLVSLATWCFRFMVGRSAARVLKHMKASGHFCSLGCLAEYQVLGRLQLRWLGDKAFKALIKDGEIEPKGGEYVLKGSINWPPSA